MQIVKIDRELFFIKSLIKNSLSKGRFYKIYKPTQ